MRSRKCAELRVAVRGKAPFALRGTGRLGMMRATPKDSLPMTHSASPLPRARAAVTAAALLITSGLAMADASKPPLFKIVTVKDEVIVAVPKGDATAPAADAGAIGQALAAKGALTVWQYATRKGGDGALELAPLRQISVLRHDSLRVEPYAAAVRVLPLPQ